MSGLLHAIDRLECSEEELIELIDAGADVNETDSGPSLTVLELVLKNAFRYRHMVKLLLDAGADVGVITSYGDTLLSNICRRIGFHNDLSWISAKILIDYGVNVNFTRHKYGITALMWASITNRPYTGQVLKMLLNAGADVLAKYDNMNTVLRISTMSHINRDVECAVKMLIEADF